MTMQEKFNGSNVRILLVEDDDGDAKAVIRGFKTAKIANEIVRAIDGVDALEHLKGKNGKASPDTPFILLVDINMPRMNGIELIAEIREDPELHDLVIFVLTTSNRDEDRVRAYNHNVAGFLLKQNAGDNFVSLVSLLDSYWRIVELPK